MRYTVKGMDWGNIKRTNVRILVTADSEKEALDKSRMMVTRDYYEVVRVEE